MPGLKEGLVVALPEPALQGFERAETLRHDLREVSPSAGQQHLCGAATIFCRRTSMSKSSSSQEAGFSGIDQTSIRRRREGAPLD
jgi:hypothetical protein